MRRPHPVLAVLVLASSLVLATVASTPAEAANPDGDLAISVIAAPNLVVDSNVESPSSYGPEAAHLGATICNTGTDPLSNVFVNIGNFDPDGNANPADSTPGVYPARTHAGLTGTFALTHDGGVPDDRAAARRGDPEVTRDPAGPQR